MASDIKLVFYSSTITMMHGPINIIFIISLYMTTVRQQWRSARNIATVLFICCSHCLLNCGFRSLSGWPPLLYGKREDILSTSFMIQSLVFEEIDELSIVMHHHFLLESTIAYYLQLLQPSPHLNSSISTFVVASHLHLCLQSFPLPVENFPTKCSKNFSFSSCLLFHQSHPSCFCSHRTSSLCHFLPTSAFLLRTNVHLNAFF